MDTEEGLQKHRHDVGHPDHNARAMEQTTRGIQFALGTAIVATLGLLIYLAMAAGRAL